jgi:hypothetical protein
VTGCITEDGTPAGEGPNQCTLGKALQRGKSMAISSDGLSFYLAAAGSNADAGQIVTFRRDPSDGSLTERPGAVACYSPRGLADPNNPENVCSVGRGVMEANGVAVSPDDRSVYVTSGRGAVAIFDREIDVTPPQTLITAGPPDGSSAADDAVAFAFASSEPGSTFACGVDGGPLSPCATPFATLALGAGQHTFVVRAIDIDGNADPSPASRSFTILVPPRAATAVAAGPGDQDSRAPAGSAAAADLVAPRVSGYRLTSRRFAVEAARTPPVGSATGAGARGGTTFRYTLSEAATVTIVISRQASGRRLFTLTRASGRGPNRLAFSGRTASRALAPGSYRAALTATDRAGNTSRKHTVVFRVVKR